MRSYTPAERRQRRGLVWKGARQAFADADTSGYDAKIAKLDAKAEERGALERAAMSRRLEAAKHAAADAKAAERLAPREERQAARQASRDAQREVERIQREARKYGL